MPTHSDYEHKVDQYHNNYASSQTIANNLAKFTEAANQKMIALYEGLAAKAEMQ